MAYLVSDVIAKVKEELPAFYPTGSDPATTPTTEAQALSIVQDVHAEIVMKCGLYSHTTLDVPLVAGQREYAFDADAYNVISASYVQGANSSLPMRQTSIDKLDYDSRGWRDLSSTGTPFQYYIDGNAIGFWMTPNVTTLIYPLVRLSVLERNELATLSSPLPAQVPSVDAWVWGTCLRWVIRNRKEDIGLYAPLYKGALKDLKKFSDSRLLRDKPTLRPRFPRVGY